MPVAARLWLYTLTVDLIELTRQTALNCCLQCGKKTFAGGRFPLCHSTFSRHFKVRPRLVVKEISVYTIRIQSCSCSIDIINTLLSFHCWLSHTSRSVQVIDFSLFSKAQKTTESETTSRINTGVLYPEGEDISHHESSDHHQPACSQQAGRELPGSISKYRGIPEGDMQGDRGARGEN